MPKVSFGQASYSNNSFVVPIMFDKKRKYDYDLLKSKTTDVHGNIINNAYDEELIKELLNSPEFKELKEFMIEKKEDNELVH